MRRVVVRGNPDGTLFRIVQFPPDIEFPTDDGASAPFWHATEATDCNMQLSGEIALLTDHGEMTLSPHDTVIVRGGRHAWSTRTDTPAALAAVSVSSG